MVVDDTIPLGEVSVFRPLKAAAEAAYRRAIAAQVEGRSAESAWDEWEDATAALLLISWADGAETSVAAAGIDSAEVADIPVARFAAIEQPVSLRFRVGPSRRAVERYTQLLPITRQKWEELVAYAFASAHEMREDEAGNALQAIMDRSPQLAALIRGQPQRDPSAPVTPVDLIRDPAVQAVVQGTFFVTSMSQTQIEQTKDLLAKTIRGDITMSVAGKRLERLGVGDFVEQAILETGTDLTAARLETIYRTNLNRAQTQGRLDICRDKTVQAFVPLMSFSATKDKRTRETHKQMDGYVATVEQIDKMGIPAPLGFNCRCAWVPMSIAKAVSRGFCDEDGNLDPDAIAKHNGKRQELIDKRLVPDAGFISG